MRTNYWYGQDPVPKVPLGSSAPSAIERGRKTHRQREQGEAGGQRQGPQANCGLTRGTEAAADGEADDRWPGVLRAAARLGRLDRAGDGLPRDILVGSHAAEAGAQRA
jgi:hypothetical protein